MPNAIARRTSRLEKLALGFAGGLLAKACLASSWDLWGFRVAGVAMIGMVPASIALLRKEHPVANGFGAGFLAGVLSIPLLMVFSS